ncbi:MAG: uroporphyrinogen-III C-methyltransferase [Plesiomonas sp.]|uniref:uroporphyrinogen-III C-methyltransferase n=1 Tax=Plesiomonas sp. TaxID=2486279 RepID=UPI003F3F168F
MTDHKPQSSSAADEQATSTSIPAVESAPIVDNSKGADFAPANTEAPTTKSGQTLGAIAIALVIALGGGLYYHGHQQNVAQQGELAHMQQKVDTLTNALTESLANQKKLASQVSSDVNQTLASAKQTQAKQEEQIQTLQRQLTEVAGRRSNDWLLAEADYLVKNAGRKLWMEQDVTSAAALLKSADLSVAQMNDPSLLPIRQALADDISTLAGITKIDTDGLILNITSLANQVDNLKLADTQLPPAENATDDLGVSHSIRDWKANLLKSWDSFVDDFITVRRRDGTVEPLLAPNQDYYLRENIRQRLQMAVMAIPRHQNELYKQSLEKVDTWVRSYFDMQDSNTQAFLNEVDSLSTESIYVDLPQSLKSQSLIDDALQTRVRNLLAQPSAGQKLPTPATRVPATTPAAPVLN